MNRQAEHDIRRKTKVLAHAKESGNVSHTCRRYGISRDTYYRLKRQLETEGPEALINSKPCPRNPKIRVPKNVEEKILYVRRVFGLGQLRISWYLHRYYDIKVSPNGVYGVLKRHGMNRLPPGTQSDHQALSNVMRRPSLAIRCRLMSNFYSSMIRLDGVSSDTNILRSMMQREYVR